MIEKSFQQVNLTGVVNFAYINSSVNEYQGKKVGYSLNLMLTEKTEREVTTIADGVLSVAMTEGWKNAKDTVVPLKSWLPKDYLMNKFIREDKEGNHYISCKAPWQRTNKDGTTQQIYVPIWDKHGLLSDEETQNINIYGGTKVNVDVVIYAYFNNSALQGVRARLRGIQILETPEASGGIPIGSGFTFDNDNTPKQAEKAPAFDEAVPI